MSGRMIGPQAKVERAKQHIEELKSEVGAFLESEPYVVICQEEATTERKTYRVTVRRQVPVLLATITGDAIHNLRASLDLLYWQLVEAANNRPNKGDSFPFYESKGQFDNAAQGKIRRRVTPAALAAIRSIEPYAGGNSALILLNELDKLDKHRLPLTVGAQVPQLLTALQVTQGNEVLKSLPIELNLAHTFRPIEDQQILTSIGMGPIARSPGAPENHDMNYQEPKFVFQIALYEPQITQPQPIIPLLSDLAGTVENTVELFAPIL